MSGQPIVIIGAGVGGLSAAALLAARGEAVVVLERAQWPGGKMRQVPVGEARIDGGPTVFTMRWVFDEIFAAAGSRLEDHLVLERLDILARHAWGDGGRLDLFADLQRSADAVAQFSGPAEGRRFLAFSAEARRIYETLRTPFLLSQRPDPVRLATSNGLGGMTGMLRINPFEKMWTALGRHFTDARLRQLFGRYATYCGSSPFEAPATLMLVAHVEQEGVWSIAGGMHMLARALETLAAKHGAAFRYGAEAARIETAGGRVSAVVLSDGERIACSDVIVNADANAVATALMGPAAARAVAAVPPQDRSLSAIVWTVNAAADGFPLTRHNVFFSDDYAAEFRALRQGVPTDPTVYVCAQDRDGHASGPERMLILVNSPARGDRAATDIDVAERAMRQKLSALQARTLLAAGGLHRHRPQEALDTLFPATRRRARFLCGKASHGWMASLPGRRQPALPGLFLAGALVHPGQVPMAALSGRLAVESLLSSAFRRAGSLNGYRWWYIDALSGDQAARSDHHRLRGQRVLALLCLGAAALGGRPGQPLCAERRALRLRRPSLEHDRAAGRRSVTRKPDRFVVGPSRMQWRDGVLVIDIDEVTVPFPAACVARSVEAPADLRPYRDAGHARSLHRWRPVSPVAEVERTSRRPALAWSSDSYHDMS
ncbi:MAG: FAD-dependent oxidoreductase [Hyphomicrobiales bacterium]